MKSRWFFIFLALLGGGFLTLLIANRHYQRPPPDVASWGAPKRTLRFVACDVGHDERGGAEIANAIRQLNPDVVFMNGVQRRDLSGMTEALGAFPAVFHADGNAARGNAILSRLPVYDVASIPNAGVWATAVVDGTKFRVASVTMSAEKLVSAWHGIGSPPMVVGGASGRGTELQVTAEVFAMSKEWNVVEGGVVEGRRELRWVRATGFGR